MNDKYVKDKLLTNIKTAAERKGIKLKDLEAAVGVSAGYFSRLKTADPETSPALSTMILVSNVLDVPIDALVRYDLRFYGDREIDILVVLDKLFDLTRRGKVVWKKGDPNRYQQYFPNSEKPDVTKGVSNPLFDACDVLDENDVPRKAVRYHSLFTNEFYLLSEPVFYLDMRANRYFLVQVEDDSPFGQPWFELYLWSEKKTLLPVCSSTAEGSDNDAFSERLGQLFALIRKLVLSTPGSDGVLDTLFADFEIDRKEYKRDEDN